MSQIRSDHAEAKRRQPTDDPAQVATTAGHAAAAQAPPMPAAAVHDDAKAANAPVGDKLEGAGGGFKPAWQQALKSDAAQGPSAQASLPGHGEARHEARRQEQVADSQRIADQLQSIERNRRV